MTELYQQQLKLESEMFGAGILRFEKNNARYIEDGNASETAWFRRLTREFVSPMSQAIDAYKEYYQNRKGKPSASLAHLRCLSSDKAAYITIKCIYDSLNGEPMMAQIIANNIGRRIEDEVRFTKLSESSPNYINAIKESLKKRSNQSYNFAHDVLVHTEKELKDLDNFRKLHDGGVPRLEIIRLLKIDSERYDSLLDKKEFAIDYDRWIPWSKADVLQLGAKMIDIFANNILINDKPVIQKINKRNASGNASTKEHNAAYIVATDALEGWIEEYKTVMSVLSPAFEPCVIPPRPWTSPYRGGYHSKQVSSRLPLVKCKNRKHIKRLTQAQMPEVYKAVNTLQAVEWAINDRVLNVANEIRQRRIPVGLPSMEAANKPICPVPAIYSELRGEELMACLDKSQQEDFKRWKRETAAFHVAEQKRKADVREAIATINQGIKFNQFETLHFVYTLDFRGRVYAQGSLISPQGGDLQKSLIKFAKPMKLGGTGEYWFKVHGANLWGWDKLSFSERVHRVGQEEFKEMCLNIAADPVTFSDWTGADKPWQFLAWCFEYSDLLDWIDEGQSVELFLSHVAVAMDGSCSGIQHYSAMLRDEVGGKEVNLLPSSEPQDIYRAVSDVVIEWLEAILDNKQSDVPIYENLEEKFGAVKCYKFAEEWLRVGVTRNTTKKPVMTLPYGSSQLTCRDSIDDYLSDLQKKADKKALAAGHALGNIHSFTEDDGELPRKEAVTFASSLVWKAIGQVVVAARSGMKFIKSLTKHIAGQGKGMEWITPTGFIVLQEVFEEDVSQQVFTQMMGGCKFRVSNPSDKICPRRMASSSAPNFVHSMDASHLIKVVNAGADKGLDSIAVIHDSFGAHAGATELFRACLTEQFVKMYQDNDVLADFKAHNEELLREEIKLPLPPQGKLVLEDVLISEYCFA